MTKAITLTAIRVLTLTAGLPIQVAQAQIHEDLWGLSMIGVGKAREEGFHGNGVVVGVMDDAI